MFSIYLIFLQSIQKIFFEIGHVLFMLISCAVTKTLTAILGFGVYGVHCVNIVLRFRRVNSGVLAQYVIEQVGDT